MTLPRFVVLQGDNKKYMCLKSSSDTLIDCTGDEVVSPHARFELERAEKGDGLLNIRSCYNNKYLVLDSEKSSEDAAKADKPEENESLWSCTLFKFEDVNTTGDVTKATLRHLHHDVSYYVVLGGSSNYTIIDWESLVILPKHVAFKGDNGRYLSARWMDGDTYLQFSSEDIGDSTVGFEVFTNGDGSIRFKSEHVDGGFWRRCSSNYIFCDSKDSTSTNKDALFWPIKVDDKVIALRSLGNGDFCHRLTTHGKTDCLFADAYTICKEARLEVVELVLSRKIYSVNFRLSDARIYGQSVLTMATGDIVNRTQETNTVDLKLFYEDTTSSRWDCSQSLTLGGSVSLEAAIPRIGSASVNIWAEFTETYQWGNTEVSVKEVETVYRASVPPMTRVKVSLLATKGSCDVPFSYTQRDTFTNGKQIFNESDDGLYTGNNYFNFKYETSEEKLEEKQEK